MPREKRGAGFFVPDAGASAVLPATNSVPAVLFGFIQLEENTEDAGPISRMVLQRKSVQITWGLFLKGPKVVEVAPDGIAWYVVQRGDACLWFFLFFSFFFFFPLCRFASSCSPLPPLNALFATCHPPISSRAGIKVGHRLIRVNNVSAMDLRHEELIVVAQQKEKELDLLVRVGRTEELRIMTSFMMAPRRVRRLNCAPQW